MWKFDITDNKFYVLWIFSFRKCQYIELMKLQIKIMLYEHCKFRIACTFMFKLDYWFVIRILISLATMLFPKRVVIIIVCYKYLQVFYKCILYFPLTIKSIIYLFIRFILQRYSYILLNITYKYYFEYLSHVWKLLILSIGSVNK